MKIFWQITQQGQKKVKRKDKQKITSFKFSMLLKNAQNTNMFLYYSAI